MPYVDTPGGKKVQGGFASEPPPGMSAAPRAHAFVQTKNAETLSKNPELFKGYNQLSRIIRIINRAQKGPLKDKPFAGKFDGKEWPEGAQDFDEATWLQPGEYMDVPKDVALHLVGNVWEPTPESRMDLIRRYGDYEYERPHDDKTNPRGAPMKHVGPPAIPDLVVCEVGRSDARAGDYIAIFDLYCPEWAKADEKQLVKV